MMQFIIICSGILAQADPADTGDKPIPYVMLIGAFFLVFFSFYMMWRTRKRIDRGQSHQQLSARERVNERYDMSARQIHGQMGELMAELAELARQVNGQLDTRMARLEILLREADETLARLEATGQATNGRLTQTKAVDEAVGWEPPRNPLLNSPLHQEVISLKEGGGSVLDIAQKMGRPAGEIELILSLHGKNKNSSKSQ